MPTRQDKDSFLLSNLHKFIMMIGSMKYNHIKEMSKKYNMFMTKLRRKSWDKIKESVPMSQFLIIYMNDLGKKVRLCLDPNGHRLQNLPFQ